MPASLTNADLLDGQQVELLHLSVSDRRLEIRGKLQVEGELDLREDALVVKVGVTAQEELEVQPAEHSRSFSQLICQNSDSSRLIVSLPHLTVLTGRALSAMAAGTHASSWHSLTRVCLTPTSAARPPAAFHSHPQTQHDPFM